MNATTTKTEEKLLQHDRALNNGQIKTLALRRVGTVIVTLRQSVSGDAWIKVTTDALFERYGSADFGDRTTTYKYAALLSRVLTDLDPKIAMDAQAGDGILKVDDFGLDDLMLAFEELVGLARLSR